MHAATVEADNAVTCSRQWQGHVDEHECPVGPVHMDAGVRPYRLARAHMDDDTPVRLLAWLDPSCRVHAGDDDHAGLPTGLMKKRIARLGGVAPADEAQAATARLEAGDTATSRLLASESGGPFGILDPVRTGQYGRRNTRHPRILKTHLFIRKQLDHVRPTQRLLAPIDDPARLVLDGYVVCSLFAPLVESGAPSVAQPRHDTLGITSPAGIVAVVHAEEDARANVLDAVDADLLAHRGPPPSVKALCVLALDPSAEARGMNFFGHTHVGHMSSEQAGFAHFAQYPLGYVHVAPVGHMHFEYAVIVVGESHTHIPSCQPVRMPASVRSRYWRSHSSATARAYPLSGLRSSSP